MKEKIAISFAIIIVLAFSSSTEAQKTTNPIPRIGYVSATGAPGAPSALFDAFRLGLRELGYIDGRNVSIERRYANGRLDRVPALVKELVQQKVDVILAANNVGIQAAREATKMIPIVMISSVDPIAAGYVKSFERPGTNVTGLAWLNRDISAKRVELLKEILPNMSRLGVLWDAAGPGPAVAFKEYEASARAFKLEIRSLEVRGSNPDFIKTFQAASAARVEALVVVGNPLMAQHATQVFDLATKNDLPTMTEQGTYVTAGGLVSYGANFADLHRRAAGYVVEILQGANPADLQVRLATKFETYLNLKTARELGLVMPQHVLLQADKVIK